MSDSKDLLDRLVAELEEEFPDQFAKERPGYGGLISATRYLEACAAVAERHPDELSEEIRQQVAKVRAQFEWEREMDRKSSAE